MKPRVCVLVGPTASGKSAVALAVAQMLDMEILSADSMQIYRGMDIGTAKPTVKERELVPHYMIDVANPDEKYTAARYREEGTRVLENILSRDKMPLVVGGTGLYISALLDCLDFAGVQGGGAERRRWEEYWAEYGAQMLYDRLCACDPETATRLHPNDTRRVVRALEVFSLTDQPISRRAGFSESPYELCMAGLSIEREELYHRIDARVLNMMQDGLLEEAERLFAQNASTAAQALGYKELFGVLHGKISIEQGIEAIQRATRRYAKRQETWFKRDSRIRWFSATDTRLAHLLATYFRGDFLRNQGERAFEDR